MLEISKGWAHTVARAYAPHDHARQDDLAQEALIAAWRAGLKGHRGGNQARAARQRLLDLHHAGQWFGRPSTRGKRSAPDVACLELIEETEAPMEDVDLRLDVARAVERLSHDAKLIVHWRIWEEMTWDDIALSLRVSRPTVMKVWDNEIAPKLREALA